MDANVPESFLERVLASTSAPSAELLSARPWPHASFMHGWAGLSFFFAELHRLRGHEGSAEKARTSIESAIEIAERAPHDAFAYRFPGEDPASSLDALREGVFTGWGGIGYVAMLVGSLLGDAELTRRGEEHVRGAFARHKELPNPPSELFMGTAGYVALAHDLERRGLATDRIRSIAGESENRLLELLGPPLRTGMGLGAAHGRTGELLVLVRRSPARAPLVRDRLDELLDLAERDDALIAWPERVGGEAPGERWSSFCGGGVGHGFLFEEAARAYGEPHYVEAAAIAAETMQDVRRPLQVLCCGSAGQAVLLHRHASRTGSEEGLQRSVDRLADALRAKRRVDPISLFQGRLGLAFEAMLLAEGKDLFLPMMFEG